MTFTHPLISPHVLQTVDAATRQRDIIRIITTKLIQPILL